MPKGSIVGMFNLGKPDGMPSNPFIKHRGKSAGKASGSSFSISPLIKLQYSTESHNKLSARGLK